MIPRIANCSKTHSFFLFGARATGKSSYLDFQWSKNFKEGDNVLWIDLLEPEKERELILRPSLLEKQITSLNPLPNFVVIDEIQKVPKLLDIAHRVMQKKQIKFALTGSSSRKLKRQGANLLAGRAFLYKLHPLTFLELKESFNLQEVLQKGSLPQLYNIENDNDKIRYLKAYTQTYLKEEIVSEQIIRHIEPFHYFLEVAGQCNGQILNYSKIAREASIEPKSCQRYFQILEDTFLGFHLPSYGESIRKQQIQKPKFYLFDLGVARALSGALDVGLTPSTYSFGNSFEHLIILEAYRLNEYLEKSYKLSYFRSKDGVEIDLILQKANEKILVEIKSKSKILEHDLKSLKNVRKSIISNKQYVLSLDKTNRKEDGIIVIYWKDGLKDIFDINQMLILTKL